MVKSAAPVPCWGALLRSKPVFSIIGVLALGHGDLSLHGQSGRLPVDIIRQPTGGISLTWSTVPGRTYDIQTATDLTLGWGTSPFPGAPQIATGFSQGIDLQPSTLGQFIRLREGTSPYDPVWESVAPLRTLFFSYDSTRTSEQNGARLKAALVALIPGDRLEITTGTYSINSYTTLNLTGTSVAPIWVTAAPGAQVVITRPDANQNLLNFGSGAPARYLCLRGIEFVGGSDGLRLYDCAQIWIDRCRVHESGDVGISANAVNTSHIHLTRNEVWNTGRAGDTGEGFYLGGNNGSVIMSESIIALNHVHDTRNGPSQGDGIELKQGSWGNLIAANHVHDCNYPCILVYGTAGKPVNVVENNLCYRSGDNTMQIQGECIVRNNLIIAGDGSAFASQTHQGAPIHLQVLYNTFVNVGTAVRLSQWSAAAGMVFANNACYSQTGAALNAVGGLSGVRLGGNVTLGTVTAGLTGFKAGHGLEDFMDLAWDASHRDARPAPSSLLRTGADNTITVGFDLEFLPRFAPQIVGCKIP